MSRILKSFTEDVYIKGEHTKDKNDVVVPSWFESGVKRDLTSAIWAEFPHNNSAQMLVIGKIKKACRAIYPKVYNQVQNDTGRIEPRLYDLSDALSYSQIRKLILMV